MSQKNRPYIMHNRTWIYPLFFSLVMLFGVSAVTAASLPKPTAKLSFRLEALSDNLTKDAQNQISLRTLGLAGEGPLSLIKSEQGQLMVYIRVSDIASANLEALKNGGADITHVSNQYRMVTAYVDLSDLKQLSSLSFVENIREATKPMRRQTGCPSATTSEGDVQLKADQAREQYGVDGSGITVGVLSDSYAGTSSPTSASDDIHTGDLPGLDNPCGHTTEVVVVEDYLESDASDEGRAMLQIVHDLAPGSRLAFATASSGFFAFADNIRLLRSQADANIIVDDVSYFAEPFFQDGPICSAIIDVTNDGAQYYTSAGNSNATDGNGHNIASYEAEAFRPITCPTVTIEGLQTEPGNACHNFNPSGNTPYQEFVLANEGYIILVLNWAESWNGVVTDLDIFVTDTSYNVLTLSADYNTGVNGTQIPYETVQYQNQTGSPQTIRVMLARYEGTDTPRSKYVLIRSNNISSSLFNPSNSSDIFGSSIFGHSGCANALSIAAVPYDDSTSPESFTSHGYFTVYYGLANGTSPAAKLSTPQTRKKPDIAATDGGATTFFAQQIDGVWRFYGTSAAAPHAAAVGALMTQKYYKDNKAYLNQTDAESALEKSAASIANGGPTISGAGLVDAAAAIKQMIESGGTANVYAGYYEGEFSGGTYNGDWKFTVSATGGLKGSFHENSTDSDGNLSGNVTSSGAAAFSTGSGDALQADFQGTLNTSGNATGNWTADDGDAGTFTGQETAGGGGGGGGGGVVDDGDGSGHTGGCFFNAVN